jgi:2-keto-4-pentenoate hydratase
MDQDKVVQAARLLAEARRTGVPIKELPEECRPTAAAEANAICAETTRLLGEEIGGWKITFLYKPREVPFLCHLFKALIFDSPARVPARLTPSLCIESEITFRLLADLPPRAAVYKPEEVAAAVEACPSMEIVDTRFDTRYKTVRQRLNERATLIEANADYITSGAFVVGQGVKSWREIDFSVVRVRMTADDKTVFESIGGHAFRDPFLPVVVMANELRRGPGLKAGQLVATGSFAGFFPVQIGQRIVSNFEGVGQVEAMFVE